MTKYNKPTEFSDFAVEGGLDTDSVHWVRRGR